MFESGNILEIHDICETPKRKYVLEIYKELLFFHKNNNKIIQNILVCT